MSLSLEGRKGCPRGREPSQRGGRGRDSRTAATSQLCVLRQTATCLCASLCPGGRAGCSAESGSRGRMARVQPGGLSRDILQPTCLCRWFLMDENISLQKCHLHAEGGLCRHGSSLRLFTCRCARTPRPSATVRNHLHSMVDASTVPLQPPH